MVYMGLAVAPFVMVEIMHIEIELGSKNPFGQVKSGSILLRGCLARGQWNEIKDDLKLHTSTDQMENIEWMEVCWDRPTGNRLNWEKLQHPLSNQVLLFFLPFF